jgi:hypothetical protein
MKDPERLLISSGDDLERELLGSLRGDAPPTGAKAETWRKVGAQLAAVSIIGGTVGSAAATTATTGIVATLAKASAVKLAIGIAAAALVVGGGAVMVHRIGSHAVAPPDAVIPVTNDARERALAAAPVEPVPDREVPPAPAAVVTSHGESVYSSGPPKAIGEPTMRDRLDAESALLTAARADLRGGDAEAAQATLARMQAEFPHGVLAQEREVLTIEALAADGKADAASRRARAFMAAHPESPHSARLARFVRAP